MHNHILSLGPFTVHGYGLMIGIGIVAALSLAWRRAEKRSIPQEKVTGLVILVMIAGFLGAKLLFLITELPAVLRDPLPYLGSDGFVVYGGIALGFLAVWLWCRKKQQSLGKWADLLLPGVALAQGFGRIGCFLAGCCYGRPTVSPLGVVFPADSLAPAGVSLLPTQLFSAAGDFLLAVILLRLDRRGGKEGHLMVWYLALYGAGRFILEFFRGDPRGAVGVLSTSQFISLFAVAGAGLLAIWRQKRSETNGTIG